MVGGYDSSLVILFVFDDVQAKVLLRAHPIQQLVQGQADLGESWSVLWPHLPAAQHQVVSGDQQLEQ